MELPDAHSPLAGGRYRLVEEIGQGGMSTVYRGIDTALGVERAIKILEPKLAETTAARMRFIREGHAMARLSHPNIATVYDVGADETLFLVMELLGGGSLADYCAKHGRMNPTLAVTVMASVLDGLHAAHKNGIVHRDVKPANILFTTDGRPKMVDFGIAQVEGASHLTGPNAQMGSWYYMAPEQQSDPSGTDGRADLFSIAASLYHVITDQRPIHIYFDTEREQLLHEIPEALRPVLTTATQRMPEKRFADAQVMRQALLDALQKLPPAPADAPPLGGGSDGPAAVHPITPPTAAEDTFDDPERPASQIITAKFRIQDHLPRKDMEEKPTDEAPAPRVAGARPWMLVWIAVFLLAGMLLVGMGLVAGLGVAWALW